MKKVLTIVVVLLTGVFFVSTLFAGNVEKGKALFNDPKLGGGTAGKSCQSCHPDGKGIDPLKKEYTIMGKKVKSIEEAVNLCIEMALKGKPIDPKGSDMADIVSYLKSLTPSPKKKKAIEGC